MGRPAGRGRLPRRQAAGGPGPKEHVEILSLEATRTDLVAEHVAGMVGFAVRTRVMGSLALSLCHLAAGRMDAVVSLKPARSVDIAAAQLLVRERGLAIDLPEAAPFGAAPLDLAARSRVVAAATPALCAELSARRPSRNSLLLGLESPFEICADGGPLVVRDRVVGRVAQGAVADEHVLDEDALEAGRDRLQSGAGALVQARPS